MKTPKKQTRNNPKFVTQVATNKSPIRQAAFETLGYSKEHAPHLVVKRNFDSHVFKSDILGDGSDFPKTNFVKARAGESSGVVSAKKFDYAFQQKPAPCNN